jgi:hypothetical protein
MGGCSHAILYTTDRQVNRKNRRLRRSNIDESTIFPKSKAIDRLQSINGILTEIGRRLRFDNMSLTVLTKPSRAMLHWGIGPGD